MGLRKIKEHRKIIKHLSHNENYKEPFQVLVHHSFFLPFCTTSRTLRDIENLFLGTQIRLFVRKCCLEKTAREEQLNDTKYPSATAFHELFTNTELIRRKCWLCSGEKEIASPLDKDLLCMREFLGKGNPNNYILAVSDARFRAYFGNMSVPIVSYFKGTLTFSYKEKEKKKDKDLEKHGLVGGITPEEKQELDTLFENINTQ